jgi:hypothetical protein
MSNYDGPLYPGATLYGTADDDPNSTDPNQSVVSMGHDMIEERRWQVDKAPDILERYRKNIVPIQETPSDRIAFYTYPLAVGTVVQIVSRQPEGVGCRVRLWAGGNAGQVALLSSPNVGNIVAQTGVSVIQNAFILPVNQDFGGAALGSPIMEFRTRAGLWATASIGAPVLSVAVETYDIAAGPLEVW